jgi:hypothetical protein
MNFIVLIILLILILLLLSLAIYLQVNFCKENVFSGNNNKKEEVEEEEEKDEEEEEEIELNMFEFENNSFVENIKKIKKTSWHADENTDAAIFKNNKIVFNKNNSFLEYLPLVSSNDSILYITDGDQNFSIVNISNDGQIKIVKNNEKPKILPGVFQFLSASSSSAWFAIDYINSCMITSKNFTIPLKILYVQQNVGKTYFNGKHLLRRAILVKQSKIFTSISEDVYTNEKTVLMNNSESSAIGQNRQFAISIKNNGDACILNYDTMKTFTVFDSKLQDIEMIFDVLDSKYFFAVDKNQEFIIFQIEKENIVVIVTATKLPSAMITEHLDDDMVFYAENDNINCICNSDYNVLFVKNFLQPNKIKVYFVASNFESNCSFVTCFKNKNLFFVGKLEQKHTVLHKFERKQLQFLNK